MVKVKTSELTGLVLNCAVAKCEGYTFGDWHAPDGELQVWVERIDAEGRGPAGYFPADSRFHYSTDWAQGGPIVEREHISLDNRKGEPCRAFMGTPVQYAFAMFAPEHYPLIAAMRCYVASKLGEEVEIPDSLVL